MATPLPLVGFPLLPAVTPGAAKRSLPPDLVRLVYSYLPLPTVAYALQSGSRLARESVWATFVGCRANRLLATNLPLPWRAAELLGLQGDRFEPLAYSVVNPLLGLPFWYHLSREQRASVGAIFRSYCKGQGPGHPLVLCSMERRLLVMAFQHLSAQELTDVIGSSRGGWVENVVDLVLEAGNQDLAAQLLQRVLRQPNPNRKRLTKIVTKAGNLAMVDVLKRYNGWDPAACQRHLSDELTAEVLVVYRVPEPLLLDLARLRRFDLLHRFADRQQQYQIWALIVVLLLMAGYSGSELPRLLGYCRDFKPGVEFFVRAISTFVKPQPEPDGWVLAPSLPATWQDLARDHPQFVREAVFLHAGMTGNVATMISVLQAPGVPLIQPQSGLHLAVYFPPSVAMLPALQTLIKGKVKLLQQDSHHRGCFHPETVLQLKSRIIRIDACQGLPPSVVAQLGTRVLRTHTSDYLNEQSFVPDLDLPALAQVLDSVTRITSLDRWIWRASLRELLPPDLKQEAAAVMERMMAKGRAGWKA